MRYPMKKRNFGQTATEYMLVLAGVAAVTLIGFRTYLPKVTDISETYFNRTSAGIAGKPNPCGDHICNMPMETPDNCCFDCGGCSSAEAPIDGGWTVFGPCSESCGGGISTRTCTNPTPQFGGADCDGPASIACNTDPCPPDPVCTWNPWSACTVPCGGGTMSRTCDGCPIADCPGGVPASTSTCNTQACVGGVWNNWSACSVACGGEGVQSRTCVAVGTPGATSFTCTALGTIDTIRCYLGPCPVPGTWCAWEYGGVLNGCSEQCNGGIQTRECNCPPPEAGGAFCPDSGYTTTKVDLFTQTCNTQPCLCLPIPPSAIPPTNASPCPAPQQDLSGVHNSIQISLVTELSCDGSTLCQYSCNPDWHKSGNSCVQYSCQNDFGLDRSVYCYSATARTNNLDSANTNFTPIASCPGTAATSASDTVLCYKDCVGLFVPSAGICNCPATTVFNNGSPCDCCCPQGGSAGRTHIYTCSGTCS